MYTKKCIIFSNEINNILILFPLTSRGNEIFWRNFFSRKVWNAILATLRKSAGRLGPLYH